MDFDILLSIIKEVVNMVVPFKDITYSVWDPTEHKPVLNTADREQAVKVYESHARKDELELWKISTTSDGWYEHARLA
jgi:hypothetical protein